VTEVLLHYPLKTLYHYIISLNHTQLNFDFCQ